MFNIKEKILGKKERVKKETKIEDHEHRRQVTQMLKIIHMCEMPEHIKRVMRTRIWGIRPDVFMPLTCEQIAFVNIGGKREPTQEEVNVIREIEEQGKFHCEQFLLSMQAQEIVEKFNEKFTKHKGQMFSKTNFEKKGFSV